MYYNTFISLLLQLIAKVVTLVQTLVEYQTSLITMHAHVHQDGLENSVTKTLMNVICLLVPRHTVVIILLEVMNAN